MFNWLDYDGSATQRTGPTIVGSWPAWWQLAPDCSYEVGCGAELSSPGGGTAGAVQHVDNVYAPGARCTARSGTTCKRG